MATWSNGGNWSPSGGTNPNVIPESRYSDLTGLGELAIGATYPAGTTLPAWGGIARFGTGQIFISGVDCKAGDAVYVVYEGTRTTAPASPAQRRVAAAGPGAPGINAIADGTIELSLSSPSDGNYTRWYVQKRGP